MKLPAWDKQDTTIPDDVARNLGLDFEIKLFESVVSHDPDHVDALFSLGDSYTKKGLYEKGLDIDKQLVSLLPDNAVVYYNLACSHSLLMDLESALEALEKSLELGYTEFEFIEEDNDLENLRQDPRYHGLIDKYNVMNSG